MTGDHITLYDRKSENAVEWKVVTVLDELVSLVSAHPDQMGKYENRWQKCDTDKILLGDTYVNLSRTRTKRDLYEKRLNPPQRKERHGAASDPQSRADGDENMDGEHKWAKEGDKMQVPGEGSEYGSSEDDQND